MDESPKQKKSCIDQANVAGSRAINQVKGSSVKFAGILMSNDANVKNEFAKFSTEEQIEALGALRDIQQDFIAGKSLEEIAEYGFWEVSVFTGYNGKRPPFILHQNDVGIHILAEMNSEGFCQIHSVWLFDKKEKLRGVPYTVPGAVESLVDQIFTRYVS